MQHRSLIVSMENGNRILMTTFWLQLEDIWYSTGRMCMKHIYCKFRYQVPASNKQQNQVFYLSMMISRKQGNSFSNLVIWYIYVLMNIKSLPSNSFYNEKLLLLCFACPSCSLFGCTNISWSVNIHDWKPNLNNF